MLSKFVVLAFFLFLRSLGGHAAESIGPEQAIKAVYLYHFSLYTEWPTPPADGVRLCIAGQEQFGSALEGITGKLLRGKPLIIRRSENMTDFADCHVVYIGVMAPGQRLQVARALANKPVLSIAEAGDADDFRPMIKLIPDGKWITFEVDLSAAKAVGLVLSSNLLRLARVVH